MTAQTLAGTLLMLVAVQPCGTMSGSRRTQRGGTSLDTLTAGPSSRLTDKQRRCREAERANVSLEEERVLGGAVALAWVQRGGGLVLTRPAVPVEQLRSGEQVSFDSTPSNTLARYVNRVGRNLAAQSSRPELEWTFGVLKTPTVNAYSAPGGYVFVTTGLLERMKSEAELAGVLAHEIAHVTERHALKLYGNIKSEQCQLVIKVQATAAVLAAGAGGEALASLGQLVVSGAVNLDDPKNQKALQAATDSVLNGYLKGMSASDEYDADWRAAALLLSAGYDPHPYISFVAGLPKAGGVFATHPPPIERSKRLSRWLETEKPREGSFVGNPDYPFSDYATATLSTPLWPLNPAVR